MLFVPLDECGGMEIFMKLKNILFVVKDIEKSKKFYKEIFGLEVIRDFGGNVILTEGLVLQQQDIWEKCIGEDAHMGGMDAELYFEENDIDGFIKKLAGCEYEIEYLNECTQNSISKRAVRICDPDGHIIEIGEPYSIT